MLPEALIAEAAAEAAAAAEGGLGFPTPSAPGCNGVALHPRLLLAAAELLGSADLRLLDSQVAAAPPAAEEPSLAAMCGSHSLLAPSSAGPEAAYALVFLGESAVTLLDPGDRSDAEWARGDIASVGEAVTVRGAPGVVFLFRSELHQCSTGCAQRVGFRKTSAQWIQGDGAGFGLAVSGMPRDWVASLAVGQRTLLGFPPPGSEYWTDDTITAVSHHCALPALPTYSPVLLCRT
jgi:hypothetical protein